MIKNKLKLAFKLKLYHPKKKNGRGFRWLLEMWEIPLAVRLTWQS